MEEGVAESISREPILPTSQNENVQKAGSATASQDSSAEKSNPALKEDRTSVYGQPDKVGFNAGHTAAIQESLPGLLDIATLHQVDSQTFLSIPTRVLIDYLTQHQADQPHAIAEVFNLISEELKQRSDPNRWLKALKSDIQQLKELQEEQASQEEITETEQYILENKKMLAECVAILPKQIIAIQNLLQNPKFIDLKNEYLATFAQTERENKGEVTHQTHAQYIDTALQTIETRLKLQTSQVQQLLADEYFTRENQVGVTP